MQTIGQLAKESGVHLETIRYYEREGLIPAPPRKSSGHRAYQPGAARQLFFIKRAQELGFSLAEIRGLLTLRAAPGEDCSEVCRRAQEKLGEVRAKIRRLEAIEEALQHLTEGCSGGRPVSECGVLEALDRDV
jgi:MerR family transcriptional regulator, copper efflux regulator